MASLFEVSSFTECLVMALEPANAAISPAMVGAVGAGQTNKGGTSVCHLAFERSSTGRQHATAASTKTHHHAERTALLPHHLQAIHINEVAWVQWEGHQRNAVTCEVLLGWAGAQTIVEFRERGVGEVWCDDVGAGQTNRLSPSEFLRLAESSDLDTKIKKNPTQVGLGNQKRVSSKFSNGISVHGP